MSRQFLLALLAFLAFISLGLPDGLLGVSWPSISATFAIPLEALGLLVAVTTAGYLTSSFLGGAILRRLSIGVVLALSTAAAAAALLGFAVSPRWPVMLVLGFVAGLGGGAIDASLNAYGARHFSARTLNWLHAFFGVGTTIGPLVVTTVLSAGLVWRWSYAIVGTAQAILAIAFFITRGRWLHAPARETGDPPPERVARTLDTLRRPVVWLGTLVFFFYSGVEMVAAQWSYSLSDPRARRSGDDGRAVRHPLLGQSDGRPDRLRHHRRPRPAGQDTAAVHPRRRPRRASLLAGADPVAVARRPDGDRLLVRADLRLAGQPHAVPRRSGARRQRDRLPDRRGVPWRRCAHRSDGCARRRVRTRGHRAGDPRLHAHPAGALRGLHTSRRSESALGARRRPPVTE